MRTYKTQITIITIVCIALLLAMIALPTTYEIACAENLRASNVLYDLQRDPNFNQADYPINNRDYSLQIIQIAESTDKELLIYVYQPAVDKDYRATSIAISRTIDHEADYHLYNLTFQNSYKTLYKYVVNDFVVSDDSTRYYLVSEIFRKFDETADDETTLGGGYTNEVSFAVSKQWEFYESNDSEHSACYDIETIKIEKKLVGYVRRDNGWFPKEGDDHYTDCHFVAFSTDKDIDRLIQAKVAFVSQDYLYKYSSSITNPNHKEEFWGDEIYHEVNVYDTEVYDIDNTKYFGEAYTLKRIQTTKEFVENESNRTSIYYDGIFVHLGINSDLKDEVQAELENTQFVLQFFESGYEESTVAAGMGSSSREDYTVVKEVTILQLKFENNGVTYNLGVIDNKQTGPELPSNTITPEIDVVLPDLPNSFSFLDRVKEWLDDFADTLMTILIVVACVLVAGLVFWLLYKAFSKNSGVTVHVASDTKSKTKSRARTSRKTTYKKKKKKGGKR